MRTRIESRVVGRELQFRSVCKLCGRVGVWHRDLSIAEAVADKHHAVEHGKAVA